MTCFVIQNFEFYHTRHFYRHVSNIAILYLKDKSRKNVNISSNKFM